MFSLSVELEPPKRFNFKLKKQNSYFKSLIEKITYICILFYGRILSLSKKVELKLEQVETEVPK